MPIKLRIPDRYASSMAELVRLSPEDLAAFLKAAREKAPSLALTGLTNSIADQLSLDREQMSDVARVLSALQTVREGFGLSVEEFVSELHAAIEASGKEDLLPKDWESFEDLLTEALSGDNAIATASKARSVASEYPLVFCSGRILTDLRPVFGSNVQDAPTAFLVTHTLKLVYHESEAHSAVFVALDRSDLEKLRIQIDRALLKEDALKAHMTAKEIKVLEEEA